MSNQTPHAVDLPPVLLVEDNPDHALISREVLEDAGLRNPVHVTESCRESLSYLEQAAARHAREGARLPCLIVLDIWLPDASGFHLLQMMKTYPALQAIPVVVLSTAQDQPTLNFAHRLGVVYYFSKPLDTDEFRHVTQGLGLEWEPLPETPDA